jgi:hypothetical protein
MPKRLEFANLRLILAEGNEDAAFIRALLRGRKNMPAFDISPNIDLAEVGGSSGFGEAIVACEAITGFGNVTDVVILADNDDTPASSFANVCRQLEKARRNGDLSRNWGSVKRPVEKAAGNPSVSVWMWPSPGQPGCLETLLWQMIETKYPKEAACVQDACKCSGADTWPISKLDKARVRCFIALACRRNPGIALSLLWQQQFKNVVPVIARAFTPISDFLRAI